MTTAPAKRKARAVFARVAKKYRDSADHIDADDREILLSRMGLEAAHLALDVATGGGHTAVAASTRVRRVVASDLTPEMLREARALAAERGRRNISFVAADAEGLPFRTGAFDHVLCRIAPHHFPDIEAAVREIVRVTKSGGMVGIIDSVVPDDPALDTFLNGVERVRDPSHVRSCRIDEWISLLQGGGLSLTHVSCAWKEHPFPEWVARTGQPPEVQREVERMFLTALSRAREFFRVKIAEGHVVSYSDEKGIFVGKKE